MIVALPPECRLFAGSQFLFRPHGQVLRAAAGPFPGLIRQCL
jgi:hypothetical protein